MKYFLSIYCELRIQRSNQCPGGPPRLAREAADAQLQQRMERAWWNRDLGRIGVSTCYMAGQGKF